MLRKLSILLFLTACRINDEAIDIDAGSVDQASSESTFNHYQSLRITIANCF